MTWLRIGHRDVRGDRCRSGEGGVAGLGQVVAVVAATAVLAVVISPSATSAAPPEPSFSGPVNYPAGVTPQSVVVAWW